MKFVPSLAAGAALSLFSAGLASAGITYVSAERALFADVIYFFEPPQADPAPPTSKSTTDLTPWSETAHAEFIDTDSDEAFSTVSQNSTLDADGITFGGAFDLRAVGEYPVGRSSLTVTFDVTETHGYTFNFDAFDNYPTEGVTDRVEGSGAGYFSTATLVRQGDPTALFDLRDQLEPVDVPGPDTGLNLDASGILTPGRYELTLFFEVTVTTSLASNAITDYTGAFTATPSAVPLPAAVWPGVAMLGAVAWRRVTRNA